MAKVLGKQSNRLVVLWAELRHEWENGTEASYNRKCIEVQRAEAEEQVRELVRDGYLYAGGTRQKISIEQKEEIVRALAKRNLSTAYNPETRNW